MIKKMAIISPLVALLALPLMALAHERQEFEINGVQYSVVIGSLNEPVTVDDKTGVDFRITKGDAPVTGLEETLKVEMIAGEVKKTTDLSPVHGTPGAYKNTFYPTVATTLSYRIFGDLEGTPIDLTFTCSPAGHGSATEDTSRVQMGSGVFRTFKSGSFGCPTDKASLGFPEESASVMSLKEDGGTDAMTLGVGALALAALAVAFVRRRS